MKAAIQRGLRSALPGRALLSCFLLLAFIAAPLTAKSECQSCARPHDKCAPVLGCSAFRATSCVDDCVIAENQVTGLVAPSNRHELGRVNLVATLLGLDPVVVPLSQALSGRHVQGPFLPPIKPFMQTCLLLI